MYAFNNNFAKFKSHNRSTAAAQSIQADSGQGTPNGRKWCVDDVLMSGHHPLVNESQVVLSRQVFVKFCESNFVKMKIEIEEIEDGRRRIFFFLFLFLLFWRRRRIEKK